MIEEIHFILHVVNGILIIIHNVDIVYLHVFKYEYYNYLYTCMNMLNFSFTFKYYVVNFSKMITDTGVKLSA